MEKILHNHPMVGLAIFGVIIVLTLVLRIANRIYPTKEIQIAGEYLTVEVANTPVRQERGLGYRDALLENSGMLFVYSTPKPYTFWMKGMRFPIDIIWLREKKVVDIAPNVPVPEDSENEKNLFPYTPRTSADMVLEVSAGFAEKYSLKIGDEMKISK